MRGQSYRNPPRGEQPQRVRALFPRLEADLRLHLERSALQQLREHARQVGVLQGPRDLGAQPLHELAHAGRARPPVAPAHARVEHRDHDARVAGGEQPWRAAEPPSPTAGAPAAAATSGNFVNRFNMDGRSYKVIPVVQRADRLTSEQLGNIHISGPDGQMVPLSSIAHIEHSVVARSLNRFQQLNAVKLSGVSTRTLDEALSFLENAADEMLPPGYSYDYTGESRQLRTEGNKFLPAFSLAILMIFLVLSVQFNSFRDPFVILAGSVPLAMFGALVFTVLKMPDPNMPHWTSGWTTTMNIYAQVGLVTLVGLIAKNGILIVEFANKLQLDGVNKLEAIHKASMIRLRPVLMTTAATIAGHFPLVLVTGAGAAARNSIGLVLVGGMAIGTVFTLFIVPSLYMLIAKDRSKDSATSVEDIDAPSPNYQPLSDRQR